MKLRKTNAELSLLSSALLLGHAVPLAFWMLSKGRIPKPAPIIPWALTILIVAHAVLSILLMIKAHKDGGSHKGRTYPKMIVPTIIQRMTGVLMLVFTVPHIAGATGIIVPSQAVHAVLPPLFFAIALTHTAVSFSKALITLGVGDAQLIKKVDIIVKIVCGVTLLADIIGFYLYVV